MIEQTDFTKFGMAKMECGQNSMADERGDDRCGAPRYHRLSVPTFDGDEDPLPWLNRRKQFFRGLRALDEEKVWLASYHMTGTTQQWYYQLERDEGIHTCPRFADFVNMRFGPPIRNNPLGELAQLRCTDTMEDYQKQFLSLLCRTEPLTPTQ